MDPLLPILLSGALFFGEADEDDEPTPDDAVAFTLADHWDETWLRIFDRSGRPDPDGPMLQRFDGVLYRRYHFDINVPDFPMTTEPIWAQQRTGVRFWVQSLSEVDLANRWQLRGEIPTWEDGYLGIRYDRRQDRITDSNVVRFDLGHRDIGGSGIDGALRFHPKWEKNDVDVELLGSYGFGGFGEVGLRLATLDVFTNASFGLLEARGRQLEEHVRQTDLPLAAALSLRTESFYGLRAELYGGRVFSQTREHEFRDEPDLDHRRHRRALLGAGLVEWEIPFRPFRGTIVGFSMQGIDAQMEWDYFDEPDENRSIRESTVSRRIYIISELSDEIRFETALIRTGRPQDESGPGVEDSSRDDREFMTSFRAFWMPTDIVGADIQLLRMSRSTSGPPDLPLDGSFNRIVTRVMLRLGQDLWTTFGVGWTWDPDTAIYDGGGMTLIWAPRQYRR